MNGRFGEFGGRYVSEMLVAALDEPVEASEKIVPTPEFQAELDRLMSTYAGRPTPLTFSDPIADGPTIQRSSERGLASGATLRRSLERRQQLRGKLELPSFRMGYAKPFYAMGEQRFAQHAAGSREKAVDSVTNFVLERKQALR